MSSSEPSLVFRSERLRNVAAAQLHFAGMHLKKNCYNKGSNADSVQ